MGHFTNVLTIPHYFYDFSFRSFAVADRLGSRPVNTFPRAILSRNRVWLRAGALHLPKSKTTFLEWPQAVVVTTDFVSRKDATTFLSFLFFSFINRLTKKKDVVFLYEFQEKKKYEFYYRKDITSNYSRAFVVFRSLPETLWLALIKDPNGSVSGSHRGGSFDKESK